MICQNFDSNIADNIIFDFLKDVLDKSQARINESIKRVAKKKFKDDTAAGEKFVGESIANLNIATNPGPIFL